MMQKTILSTADVARLFNVTETTVKRWANDGTLKCMKTPGGHRKFEMKHVIEFAGTLNFEPTGALSLNKEDVLAQKVQVAILAREFNVLKEAFVDKALSPDQRDLFIYFSYLYQHRIQLWEIYDLVIKPGMEEIGKRWESGAIDIGQEHRASHETLDALAKLQAQILVKPKNGLNVVCACPGEEQHDIGLRCASYLFESEGWSSHYLGARTPYESIINAVRDYHPAAVCLSVTYLPNGQKNIDDLAAMLHSLKSMETRVLIGGRVLCGNPQLDAALDITYCSALELLEFMKREEKEREHATVHVNK